ncbi:MAG: 3-deoxy-D-manno-octulosonic acid transferase [Bdellovibrionales bacterium]
MLSFIYRQLTELGAPFISLYLLRRRAEGREDAMRFPERFGHAARPRPEGYLVWCHAASVGEAASVLALIGRIRERHPDTPILITTGTVTSARMLADRLPAGAIHQYMPVDRAPYVARFLDHWRPDFALLIESELWPNMLDGLRRRGIAAALVNGRMSERSFRRWRRFRGWAKELLSTFALCLAQTEADRQRFTALGAKKAHCLGNLKYAAQPLPYDETELRRLRGMIGTRPVWLLASSHRGEEKIALRAHAGLRKTMPDLLTVIVPRHAVRGEDVAREIEKEGLAFTRRSKKQDITPATEIYLADTMGELGLLYRLSPVTVLGGSFVDIGGHNPIEPAQLESAIIFGPFMHNFSAIAQEFVQRQAAVQLRESDRLSPALLRFLKTPEERAGYARAAHELADEKQHVLDDILAALSPWLSPAESKAA